MQPLIYLISGLAADQRVLKNLRLEADVRFLPWLAPANAHEPLHSYAERMAEGIEPGRPALIVGVSFGGMVALQIAQDRPWLKVVQISSVNSPAQMPWHLRLAGLTGIYRLAPPQLMKQMPWAGTWFFGTKGQAESNLFKQILKVADPAYMRWAIPQLLHWKAPVRSDCVQIIGTSDRIFPHRQLPGHAIRIEGGSHLMVFSEAEQISAILNRLAKEWTESNQG